MPEKQCPLCGKIINETDFFCNECNENAQKRGTLGSLSELEGIREKNIPEPDTKEKDKEAIKPEKKYSGRKLLLFVFITIFLCIGTGVSFFILQDKQEEKKLAELNFWYSCIDEHTPLAYSKYLLAYPNGIFIKEAQEKITEIRNAESTEWVNLKGSPNIHEYYTFLGVYPDSPFKAEIRYILDSLTWQEAQEENTPEAYMSYIENARLENITGNYIAIAQERHDYLKYTIELEGEELSVMKNRLSGFFSVLSNKEMENLAGYLAPIVKNFYGQKDISASLIITSIQNEIEKKKISSISYTPSLDSLSVKKDPKGIYHTQIETEKQITYKDKKKQEVIKEILQLELTDKLLIQRLYIKKEDE